MCTAIDLVYVAISNLKSVINISLCVLLVNDTEIYTLIRDWYCLTLCGYRRSAAVEGGCRALWNYEGAV